MDKKKKLKIKGALVLAVMGGDSRSKGCEFESRYRNFFQIYLYFCLKSPIIEAVKEVRNSYSNTF